MRGSRSNAQEQRSNKRLQHGPCASRQPKTSNQAERESATTEALTPFRLKYNKEFNKRYAGKSSDEEVASKAPTAIGWIARLLVFELNPESRSCFHVRPTG